MFLHTSQPVTPLWPRRLGRWWILAGVSTLVAATVAMLVAFPGSARAQSDHQELVGGSDGAPLQTVGARTDCQASELGHFKLLCDVYQQIAAYYIGSETVATMASKAAEGVKNANLALITGTPPSCALPSTEFEVVCVEIDKVQDTEKAVRVAAEKMVAALISVDRQSFLLTPEAQQMIADRTANSVSRLGFESAFMDGDLPCTTLSASCRPVILRVYSGSPAEEAGLQEGDILVELNGPLPPGFSCSDQFEQDKMVNVTVNRGADTLAFTIAATVVEAPVAGHRVVDSKIGYLRLYGFPGAAADEVAAQLQELLDYDVVRLVLDLRDNRGGSLAATIATASLFLGEDSVVTNLYLKGQEQVRRTSRTAISSDPALLPMVVATNGLSASGSEMLVGALSDHDRATVVGRATYGKFTGQSIISIKNQSEVLIAVLRLTSLRWTTPLDRSAKGKFQPDVALDLPLCLHPDEAARRAVNAADQPPVVRGPEAITYRDDRNDPVASYTAEDPEGRSVEWSLGGPDADKFAIDQAGVLRFVAIPDWENPGDSGEDNDYQLALEVSDGYHQATTDVTVTVTKLNEAPVNRSPDNRGGGGGGGAGGGGRAGGGGGADPGSAGADPGSAGADEAPPRGIGTLR